VISRMSSQADMVGAQHDCDGVVDPRERQHVRDEVVSVFRLGFLPPLQLLTFHPGLHGLKCERVRISTWS
jgi:hypothetical protein